MEHDIAPLALEKALIGGLLVLYTAVLAKRSVELLRRRYRLRTAHQFALLYLFMALYLVLPLGLQLPERFAPLMTPFSNLFMFLILLVSSLIGAVVLYRVLGGKLSDDSSPGGEGLG